MFWRAWLSLMEGGNARSSGSRRWGRGPKTATIDLIEYREYTVPALKPMAQHCLSECLEAPQRLSAQRSGCCT